MDISTIVGIILGLALIINGIGFDKLGNFWSFSSIVIVLGGTIAAIIASFPFKQLKDIPKHFKIMMNGKRFDSIEYINTIVEFAQLARKNGLLALEEKANALEDPFFKQSLMLIVDATDPDKVKEMLSNDLDNLAERHDEGVAIYEKGAAVAPAFGMIGTLVGLVNMLKGMSMDAGGASTLGTDMSVALITTFYGCVIAHLFMSPIANKLKIRNAEEYLCKQIIIEGVLSIQSGENPKFIKEKLLSFLSQKQRDTAMNEGGESPKSKGKKGREK